MDTAVAPVPQHDNPAFEQNELTLLDTEKPSEVRKPSWTALRQNLRLITNKQHTVKHTDYILVYKRNRAKRENNKKKEKTRKKKRDYFIRQLRKSGLKVEFANLSYLKKVQDEEDDVQATDDQYVQFIKLEAPYEFLLTYAEVLNINMPLRPDLVEVINTYKKLKMDIKDQSDEEGDEEDIDEEEITDENMTQDFMNILIEDDDEEDDGEIVEEVDFHAESFWSGLWKNMTSGNTRIADDGDCFTAVFRRDKLEFFDVKSNKNPNGKPIEEFFSDSDRIRMIHYALSQTEYGKKKNGKSAGYGVKRLIKQGVFVDAYPVHDGLLYNEEPSVEDMVTEEKENEEVTETDFGDEKRSYESLRVALYEEWARYKNVFKIQPLDQIKNYFGEQIGLYFAFIGYYTYWLVFAALFGLGSFIYSLVTLNSDEYLEALKNDNRFMCPRCDQKCNYYPLNTTYNSARFSYVFDNNSTLIYGSLVAIWAIIFLEFWKRKQFELQYEWDLAALDVDHYPIRTQYETASAKMGNKKRLNTETGEVEPFILNHRIIPRRIFSFTFMVTGILSVIMSAVLIIVYRVVIEQLVADEWEAWFQEANETGNLVVTKLVTPGMFTSITASLVDLILIVSFDLIYVRLAAWFTSLELPRTQIEYDESYATKVFAFKFCNYYATLFYIAFFKDAFEGYPSNYNYLVRECEDGKDPGYRWLGCDDGGCGSDLAIQLIFVMLGSEFAKLIIKSLTAFFGQRLVDKRKDKVIFDDNNCKTQWENDFKLLGSQNWINEYLDLTIQFGFVILFSSAFPLAPLFALLNNFIKIRTNAKQLTKYSKRTIPTKTNSIGIWENVFRFLAFFSIITNALTIAFTSQVVQRLTYYFDNHKQIGGYIDYVHSTFNVSKFPSCSAPNIDPDKNIWIDEDIQQCYFRGFRSFDADSDDYTPTSDFWKDYMVKLAFVLCFNYIVYVVCYGTTWLIPDRPWQLEQKIKVENYLIREVLNLNIDDKVVEEARVEKAAEVVERSDSPVRSVDIVDSDDQSDHKSSIIGTLRSLRSPRPKIPVDLVDPNPSQYLTLPSSYHAVDKEMNQEEPSETEETETNTDTEETDQKEENPEEAEDCGVNTESEASDSSSDGGDQNQAEL